MVDNSKANESISKTGKEAEGLGSKFVSGVGKVAKFGAAIAGAAATGGAALLGLANNAAGVADRVDKLSAKIGISKQGFQEWDYVLGQNGMDVEKLQVGVKTLTGLMDGASSGNKNAIDTFSKLGLTWQDGSGKLKSQEEMMNESIMALANMENGTEKARLATELFGKAGSEMMPMLNNGAQGIEDLKNRAHELGLVMSDDAVNAGVKLGDTIDDVKDSFSAIVTQIGVRVMPIVQKFLDFILSKMPIIQQVLGTVFKAIELFVTGFVDVVSGLFGNMNLSWDSAVQAMKFIWDTYGKPLFEAIQPLIQAIYDNWNIIWGSIQLLFQTTWEILMGTWETLGKPLFDFIVGVVGLVSDFFAERMPAITEFFSKMVQDISTFWVENLQPCFQAIGDFITNVLAPAFEYVFNHIIAPVVDTAFKLISDLWNNFLKPVFGGIIDFIAGVFSGDFSKAFQGIVDTVSGIFGGIVSVVKAPLNLVIGIVNSFIKGLNKLQVPDWVPLIGGSGINIPEIPMLAKGTDYFKGGAAIVGEQGPELVTMPRGAKVTPNKETESILNKNGRPLVANIFFEGRPIMRMLAPFQDEFEEYNLRFV